MEIGMTLATIPAILALVQLIKQLGVTGKWNTLAAVVLGVVISVGEYWVYTSDLTPAGFYGAAATGLILGLSAAGLYDAAALVASKPAPVTGIKMRGGQITVSDLKDFSILTPNIDESTYHQENPSDSASVTK